MSGAFFLLLAVLLCHTIPNESDVMRPIRDNPVKISSRNGQGLHSELENCDHSLRHGNGEKDQTCPGTNDEHDDKSEQKTSALIDFHAETVTAQTAVSAQI